VLHRHLFVDVLKGGLLSIPAPGFGRFPATAGLGAGFGAGLGFLEGGGTCPEGRTTFADAIGAVTGFLTICLGCGFCAFGWGLGAFLGETFFGGGLGFDKGFLTGICFLIVVDALAPGLVKS